MMDKIKNNSFKQYVTPSAKSFKVRVHLSVLTRDLSSNVYTINDELGHVGNIFIYLWFI
jgi:hypothetical protein